jgi:hypothetical protein
MVSGDETDWSGIPYTDIHAKPAKFDKVAGNSVVKCKKITIRNAIIEDAIFELATPITDVKTYSDKLRIEVKCYWYGKKPPTCWMNITLLGKYEILQKFDGEVIRNIAR